MFTYMTSATRGIWCSLTRLVLQEEFYQVFSAAAMTQRMSALMRSTSRNAVPDEIRRLLCSSYSERSIRSMNRVRRRFTLSTLKC